jgi:hypothetical protein
LLALVVVVVVVFEVEGSDGIIDDEFELEGEGGVEVKGI